MNWFLGVFHCSVTYLPSPKCFPIYLVAPKSTSIDDIYLKVVTSDRLIKCNTNFLEHRSATHFMMLVCVLALKNT